MVPKSTAERCKKYRQKHKELYPEKDGSRKRNYCQKWKLIQLLRKKGYDFSKKKSKNITSESKKV